MDIVIGRVPVPPTVSGEWEEAFRRRVQTAKRHEGWLGVDLCVPKEDGRSRLILGRWASRIAYEAWTSSPDYLQSIQEMEPLQAGGAETSWFSVVWSESPKA